MARHALAWHESRKEFLPTPFSGFKDKDVKQVYLVAEEIFGFKCVNSGHATQAWFPGAHSDVGGSYKERLIADISLCWMAVRSLSILIL